MWMKMVIGRDWGRSNNAQWWIASLKTFCDCVEITNLSFRVVANEWFQSGLNCACNATALLSCLSLTTDKQVKTLKNRQSIFKIFAKQLLRHPSSRRNGLGNLELPWGIVRSLLSNLTYNPDQKRLGHSPHKDLSSYLGNNVECQESNLCHKSSTV